MNEQFAGLFCDPVYPCVLTQDSELLYEIEVAGPPLCVTRNGQDGGALSVF